MDLKKEKEREGKPENWEKIRQEKREQKRKEEYRRGLRQRENLYIHQSK